LYFESESLDETERKLEELDVSFFHGIHEEPWGQRTLRFFDPDGNLIEVGEPLPVFITNLIKAGMSPEEVSAKTGVAIETIRSIPED